MLFASIWHAEVSLYFELDEFGTHTARQMETCRAKTETYHNKKTNSNRMTWKWKYVVVQLANSKIKN